MEIGEGRIPFVAHHDPLRAVAQDTAGEDWMGRNGRVDSGGVSVAAAITGAGPGRFHAHVVWELERSTGEEERPAASDVGVECFEAIGITKRCRHDLFITFVEPDSNRFSAKQLVEALGGGDAVDGDGRRLLGKGDNGLSFDGALGNVFRIGNDEDCCRFCSHGRQRESNVHEDDAGDGK